MCCLLYEMCENILFFSNAIQSTKKDYNTSLSKIQNETCQTNENDNT